MIMIMGKHGVGLLFSSCTVKKSDSLAARLAPQLDIMREEEIDRGARERFRRLFAALPAGTHRLDHLRLVVPVLRGPVGEFEPPPPVLVARAHSQHAVEGLPAGIRV
jgi:hypothetical protein